MLLWPLSGFKINYYNALFTRGNALGGAIFCYFGIFFSFKRKFDLSDKLIIVIGFILLYFANSRSSMIALIVFLIIRFFLINFKKIPYKNIFMIALLVCLAVPIVYMILYNSSMREVLDNFSWIYLRKRFFSGRQYIWGALLNYISQKPFMGYGLGVTADDFLSLGWSSHNWYLQTLLQIGIMGFCLLVEVLKIIWNDLYKYKDSIVCKSVSAFLIGVLLWQCFEVTITQNNISIGILVWFIFGLGVNKNLLTQNNKHFMGDYHE